MGCITEKVPNVMSRCHTKRRMDRFFLIFFFDFLFLRRCHTKSRMDQLPVHPSFGMTMIQDIRDLFAYRSPIVELTTSDIWEGLVCLTYTFIQDIQQLSLQRLGFYSFCASKDKIFRIAVNIWQIQVLYRMLCFMECYRRRTLKM